MLEAIAYRYRTGIAWRDLPAVFGPWPTVWKWHRRIAGDGTWDRADAAGHVDWSVLVDSTIARARQHATNVTRVTAGFVELQDPLVEPPDHGLGRSRGGLSTKLHHLVDGRGLPLVIAVTPGQSGDSPMLIPLLEQLRVARPVGRPRTRPDRVRGDKAYSPRAIRQQLRDRGIRAVIPQPSDQIGHRLWRGSRGGRPVGYDRDDYRGRNVIERASPHSSNGPASRRGTTNSRPSIDQQPSSTPSSPGPTI